MSTFKRLIGGSLFVFVFAGMALAQENRAMVDNATKPDVPLVTATAAAERVRFASPGTVVQLRLEVYNEMGQKLFDTELRGGNVLDWHLQDGSGQRLPPGSYACVLTIKGLSGRLSQRLGLVTVHGEKASFAAVETAQLSQAQQQTIGPVESDGAFTVRSQNEAEHLTAVTHDGADGQLARTTGALSFRVGDFLSGNDKEQMRLTEEGNLGVGTDKPQAKLDVAGSIRTTKGIEFSDGTVQTTGLNGRKDAEGNLVPNASGTGTQDRLAKWIDNSGTLGDSLLSEAGANIVNNGANIQMTAAPIAGVDTNLIFVNANDRTTGMIASSTPEFSANNGPYFALRGNNYSSLPGQRGLFSFSTGNVASPTGNEGTMVFLTGADQVRMVIKPSGNVGVGTITPETKFDVEGAINTSTQYNIGGNRVVSIPGTENTFVGKDAGASNTTGSGNSFFGHRAGFLNTTGAGNVFFGGAAGFNNTTGFDNSFFGGGAGSSNTTGSSNSMFGKSAGSNSSTGSGNSFFGETAGSQNTTGHGNSAFGMSAGYMTTTGQSNSFFGAHAGYANKTGGGNSFFGDDAGAANKTGGFNIAIGNDAGSSLIAGSNNIYLANAGADESNHIRIGTEGVQTATFIAGISGTSVTGDAVLVDANGQLGVAGVSSRRFKQDIGAMGNASRKLMQLRPVVFRYRPEYLSGTSTLQYGLIAEEVAKVYPELVGFGTDGKPQTVRYHLLSTMLLNELQRQESRVLAQAQQLKNQAQQIAELEARLRRVESQTSVKRRHK